MNSSPFPFQDFVRAKDCLRQALSDDQERYALLTGETGTGKTALLRELRGELDRTRHRVLYFSEARRLGATGLVRVIARALRVRASLCHAESLSRLIAALKDETQHLLVWLDEAHELPEETLAEARALAECDLEGADRVQVLFAGLPRLRSEMQSLPPLWRRMVVREQITGLVQDELPEFLDHHFSAGTAKRLCEQGLSLLFERGKGAPGLLLPMFRSVLRQVGAKAKIEASRLEDLLEHWELP